MIIMKNIENNLEVVTEVGSERWEIWGIKKAPQIGEALNVFTTE
jgi:hypothetical protein